MPATPVFNRFVAGFVDRVIERATGRDDASARFVRVSPADQILAGFLTPARTSPTPTQNARGGGDADGDALELDDAASAQDGWGREDPRTADDLPQDRPSELSAIGFEWLLPRAFPGDRGLLEATVTCCVYVRTLPTLDELVSNARWLRPRRPQMPDSQGRPGGTEPVSDASPPTQHTEIVPVWTRVDLPPLVATIDLRAILRAGVAQHALEHQVAQAWRSWLEEGSKDLYPRRSPIRLEQADCTAEGYARWRRQHRARDIALFPTRWAPVIDLRTAPVATQPDCVRVSLRLINRTSAPQGFAGTFTDPNLYAVHVRARMPRAAHQEMEFADLPRSYRYDRRIAAVGINADVRTVAMDGEAAGAPSASPGGASDCTLETDTMPRRQLNRLEPRVVPGADPTFEALQRDPAPVLRRILDAMRTYDAKTWAPKVAGLPASSRPEAEADRERFRTQEITAFERGIALLEADRYPAVRTAFIWMNEAMAGLAAGRFERWRLFQIIFIVIQLPRLAAREFPELGQQGDDDVEILWFAAGGGKTEAFQGLLCWQIFFDRLRGKRVGATAMIRFPLRLLTYQQLQRTARLLAQAERIRVREGLGGQRFSLGYFVGDNTRPNTIDDDRHDRYTANFPESELRSLTRCPFCDAPVELRYDPALRLIQHLCTARERGCPSGRERLPIYVVDADIYQYLPTVIVSTVDKLALLGQNQRFANLFGRFDLVCGYHGASFRGTRDWYRKCEAAQAYADHPDDQAKHLHTCHGAPVHYAYEQQHGAFYDPGPALLIQDELHLMSEEMGTFDAHYETAAMEIMRSLGHYPWKIVAATATIERFEEHARHLYLKSARQFPCPGPEAYDSFYYQLDPDRTGRIFVGVLGVGRKHTPAVTRLVSLLYQELQTARVRARDDLSAACARYDLPQLTAQEFTDLIFRYELVLTYVLTRKGSDQVAEAIRSRVSREVREETDEHELLLQMFNGEIDPSTMLQAMEAIEQAQIDGPPAERIRGVVATNIISHGVDIDRFNIMVFGGFTRLVAEYIQASARVGRTFPGISFLVVTPQSERDRSIFERFAKFHDYLDRMVDPSAINRWPEPALEKTVGGLIAGYLMSVAAQAVGKPIYRIQDYKALEGREGAESLEVDAVRTWIRQALGVHLAPYPEYAQRVDGEVRKRYALLTNAGARLGPIEQFKDILKAMRSLRDIDAPADIRVPWDKDQAMILGLQRA